MTHSALQESQQRPGYGSALLPHPWYSVRQIEQMEFPWSESSMTLFSLISSLFGVVDNNRFSHQPSLI